MKPVAILSYDYPPNDGGISRLCSAAASGIASTGRDVTVLTLASDGRHGLARPQLRTHEVPRAKVRRDWATYRFVHRLPSEVTVVSTVWNPEGTLAWLARRRGAFVMAHGNEVMEYPAGPRYAVKHWLRRNVIRCARTVVCNSRYTERLVREICPLARTVVITPGVDGQRFRPLDDIDAIRQNLGLPIDKRVVLSVSRVDAYKGHDVVLKALAALSSADRDRLHYVVAGKGAHLEVLKALAHNLRVGECVTWLGFVDDSVLPSLYACADLFVLCTREDPHSRGVEGFGMVFLEAQAAGVPVLGTRAGGIPDAIIEGHGGWLVDQDDIQGVRDRLAQLAVDVQQFRKEGTRGRKRASREGSWETYVLKFLAVLDETL